MASIAGEVAAGFAPVREAFRTNFAVNGEVGAAVAVYQHGRKVVDLWGGLADPATAEPWRDDTLQVVFSATKSATAACAHLLAERGLLKLDAPVARYWPEFATCGKDRIPVRWLLSHRAGLPTIDRRLARADALAWEPMIEALAAQRPLWEPGTAHGYHPLTYGWLVGEVVRRVSGRSLGDFFAQEIAEPAGLDFWIGLPKAQQHRVATILRSDPHESFAPRADPRSLATRSYVVTRPAFDHNDPQEQSAQLPASNGICTARALAGFYAALITEVAGHRILRPATLAAAAAEQSAGVDRVLGVPTRYASGFALPTRDSFWYSRSAFGFPGMGGSLGFADPDTGIAFGYVMNALGGAAGDRRASSLVDAVRACA